MIQLIMNLHDSIKACDSLASVKVVDVSSQRLRTIDIMRIMGRRVYENLKQRGPSKLLPFTRMIIED